MTFPESEWSSAFPAETVHRALAIRCRACGREVLWEWVRPTGAHYATFRHDPNCGFQVALEHGRQKDWIHQHGTPLRYAVGALE